VAQATPIQAVVPKVVLPVVTPVAAAPTPAAGTAPSQGAAPVAGPGTGAGGTGSGTGSGSGGSGPGGGGSAGDGAGRGTAPRQIAGTITRRDYPRALQRSEVPIETINLQFTIGTDGYVRDCKILKSSGSALLDQHTCRLYESRYRYQPARDAAGRPEQVTVRATRSWFIVGRGGFR
jgi:protein TonB